MIRALAASLAAAALFAASVPAAAQQRGPGFRGPAHPSITGKRFSGRKQLVGRRKSRSFNPPAPQISSGKRLQRSFNPPAPFGKASSPPRAFSRGLTPPGPTPGTSHSTFGPQAPSGGQNLVGGPGSVPASLPAPSLGEASPTAAPAQPTPIPETVAAQTEPAATAEKVDEQVVHLPVQKPVVHHVCNERVVYVPVYRTRRVYRRHHEYAPRRAFRGHRAHFRHRFRRGFRRW